MNRISILVLALLLMGCQTTQSRELELQLEPALYAAQTAYRQGDLHFAEGLWRQVLDAYPEQGQVWCDIGHVNYRVHRYDAAYEAYQFCLANNPQQPDIWKNLAAIRLRQATELLLAGHAYLGMPTSFGARNNQAQRYEYEMLMQQLLALHRVESPIAEQHDEKPSY